MNADLFRHLYRYHFAENRKIWEHVASLPAGLYLQGTGYSRGSVQNQVAHLMNTDDAWFSGLRAVDLPRSYAPAQADDRAPVRERWDGVEKMMQAYLANLRDEMLLDKPFREEEDRNLVVWQVLLHVANHGTDHRAQLLRLLNDLGVKTGPQDYIFYVYENP